MKKNTVTVVIKIKNPKGRVREWGLGGHLDRHPHNPKVTPENMLKTIGVSISRTLDGHGLTGKEIFDFAGIAE